jgi:uncharacterized radical SAM superfamily protein
LYIAAVTTDVTDFFIPGKDFPSVSVTGTRCSLGCLHCRGHFLKGMTPAEKPRDLWRIATRLQESGGTGLLLSGGCDERGRVPMGDFAGTLKRIKRETELLINVHPGFVTSAEAEMLRGAGVDTVSIDVVGSDETLRDVYHLDRSTADVERSLRNLREASVPLTPHICVGVHGGLMKGEMRALEMVSESDPKALVITSLLPVRGTPFEANRTADEDVVGFFLEARRALPNTRIVLGCMRPRNVSSLDEALLREGIDGIAVPLPSTLRNGSSNPIKRVCCSLIGSGNL